MTNTDEVEPNARSTAADPAWSPAAAPVPPAGQPPTDPASADAPAVVPSAEVPAAPVIDPGPERVQQPVTAASIPLPLTGAPFAAPATSAAPAASRRSGVTHQEIIDLYAAHHDALVRFAALMAPEDGMAEDLVQEAFVRLYKSWKKIRDPEKIPAYLRSTVANLARGRGRRISTARRHQPVPGPDAASAEEGALRTETQAEVVALLRTLPDRQRQCLVLRYYEGQTESEIAATLGISIGSVRTHTARGMAALGSRLGVTS